MYVSAHSCHHPTYYLNTYLRTYPPQPTYQPD